MTELNVILCGASMKAAEFLDGILAAGVTITKVISYNQSCDSSNAFKRMAQVCHTEGIDFVDKKRLIREDFDTASVIFLVGWQYLLPFNDNRLVVFHDSLLPRYRGFAPTVTSLLCREPRIGVTALTPDDGIDTGLILGQAAFDVSYPARIEDIIQKQSNLMIAISIDLLSQLKNGTLEGTPQDESLASYSVWRDREDYLIDWSWSAEAIEDFVYALGYPYEGAQTMLGCKNIIVMECKSKRNINFTIRQPGKIWSNDAGGTTVICGHGMLQITKMATASDDDFKPKNLRSRFLNSHK